MIIILKSKVIPDKQTDMTDCKLHIAKYAFLKMMRLQ